MPVRVPVLAVLACALLLTGCNPSDRRPGLWLRGEPAAFASDWSFTDAEKEIAIEVKAPWGLPHSVTIWCAALDGTLYVGASNPDSKRWPAWTDENPDVRLLVAGKVYEARLVPLGEGDTPAGLGAAYAKKYALDTSAASGAPRVARYWRVVARS
jgi:hypothetical protein